MDWHYNSVFEHIFQVKENQNSYESKPVVELSHQSANMSVQVMLHDNQPTFTPGDIVQGTIYLKGPIHDDNFSISLVFEGKSYVQVGYGKHARYDFFGILFRDGRRVLKKPCHLEAGYKNVWPFTLRMPTHTLGKAN